MNRKGLTPLATILILALIAVAIGFGFYLLYKVPSAPDISINASSTTTGTSTGPISNPTSTTPTVPTIDPSSGPIGITVTIHGSGFGSSNTILMDELTGPGFKDVASLDGTTLTFTVPQSLAPNCAPNQACPMFMMVVTPRAYKISVTTNGVERDFGTFTVTGGGLNSP